MKENQNLQNSVLFNNDSIVYIDCSTKSLNTVHKNTDVTSNAHNIEKSLKQKTINNKQNLKFKNRNHISLQTA